MSAQSAVRVPSSGNGAAQAAPPATAWGARLRGRMSAARRSWRRLVLVGIVLSYVGVIVVAPLAALVAGALSQGWGAVKSALADPAVAGAFLLTLQISLITVAVTGTFGALVAWVLVRYPVPGRRIINGLIDLPFALSSVVVGFTLILLFGRLGPLYHLEYVLGLRIVFAVPGMVLATIFVTLPFMIRELMPVIMGLDREQERAAATLGARPWQTFLLVSLPALRWAILYGLVLTFARALGEFGAVLVVGNDIQGLTETVPLFIYRALANRDAGGAYTVALLLGALSLMLAVGIEWLRRFQRR